MSVFFNMYYNEKGKFLQYLELIVFSMISLFLEEKIIFR